MILKDTNLLLYWILLTAAYSWAGPIKSVVGLGLGQMDQDPAYEELDMTHSLNLGLWQATLFWGFIKLK